MHSIKTRGIQIPCLGLGTFQMKTCQTAVESALSLGYRHIDTAEMYRNEKQVGAAIAASGLPRGEIFLTTKVWRDNLEPEALERALERSLSLLKTDYADLYMIHWPSEKMDLPAALETLVKLRDDGLVRAIGVCNFPIALLREAIEVVGAPIACNQVEYHALLDQTPLRTYAAKFNIPIIAYAPLAQGRLAKQPVLVRIGKKHDATANQVALRWLLDQDGVAAIPKATHPSRQKSNLDALALKLDNDDRDSIASLPKARRFVNPNFGIEWDVAAA
jgi:2,5-diketo-D-gluconate reductase B